jgi:ATP/maltotriose-dependent transcriptional regulator MalT
MLREHIQRAASGGGFLALEGEPGIGKTRLLDEAVRIAGECGFDVFTGAGDELEQPRSYGLLIAAVASRSQAEADELRAIAARPHHGGADRRVAVIDRFTSFVERSSDVAPVAMIVDDLHWADDETLQVFRAVVRRSASFPFAFIASTRPSPSNAELERLVDVIEQSGSRITLDPLDDPTVEALVDRLVTAHVTPELLARTSSARGNPFFVIEILAGAIGDEDSGEISKDVRRIVLRRILHLSDDARRMLRLASLLGASIDPSELAAVFGRRAVDLIPVVDEAISSGVLDEHDGTLAFRHDIVREAIYSDIPASLRKRSHRDVARTLAAAGAPARRVAMHLAQAAGPGDGEAVAWLRRAAAEEIHRSPAAAADMLGQAAVLVERTDPTHDELQAERVQALAWAGRVTDATALATDVLARLRDPSLAADVRASLGESLTFRGRLVEAAGLLEAASAAASPAQRGLLLAESAACRMVSGMVREATELVDRALVETAAVDDPRARSLALGVSGMLAVLRGDPTGVELARQAVRIADEDFLGDAHRYLSRVFLGYTLHETDRIAEAIDTLREGLRLDEARGVSWAIPCYHALLGLMYFRSGEWDEAVTELETAKAVLDDMDSTFLAPLTHGLLAQIAFYRDDVDTAERELADGETKLAETGQQYGAEILAQTRAELAAQAGDTSTAAAIMHAIWDAAEGLGLPLIFGFTAPERVEVSIEEGDHDVAAQTVETVEKLAVSMGTRFLAGTALLCRAMVTRDAGLALEAVDALRASGRRYKLAQACESTAAIVGDGDPARARELLLEAFSIYEGAGALRDTRRVSRALDGGSERSRTARRRPVSGWESLSPAERRVVKLVAEGLTNPVIAERLVVSRRTVETHVSHLFRKLGITSRVELVLLATRELSRADARAGG